MRRWTPLLLGLLAGLGLSWWIARQFEIRQTFPANAAQVGVTARVGIRFGQPMDHASTEARFQLAPATPGSFRWEAETLWFEPLAPLEVGQTYTASLESGARTAAGRALSRSLHWQFQVRAPQAIYAAPANDRAELWAQPLGSDPSAAVQLTQTGGRVFDYAVAVDGSQIGYSLRNDQGGVDLWWMGSDGRGARRLVDCGPARCSSPAWSPQGARLAYSREDPSAAGGTFEPPRLWTVAVASGEAAPLFQDENLAGADPHWSPDGGWLAVYDSFVGGIRAVNLETGEAQVLPTLKGLVGAWSPSGAQMLFTSLRIVDEQPQTAILWADLQGRGIQTVLEERPGWFDFGVPAWSPAGGWMALSLRSDDPLGGRELWLMRPDGSEARPIIAELGVSYGAYAWDPLGERLIFQRFRLDEALAAPEVLVWTMETGELSLLRADAWLPGWLP